MNRLELTRALPVMRPARIMRTVEVTSEQVSLEQRDIACSPRASVAYSLVIV